MVQILVITYILSVGEIKCYIFDDYIIRINNIYSDSLQNANGIKYQMLDLNRSEVHTVFYSRNARIVESFAPPDGAKKNMNNETYHAETEEIEHSGFRCLKVTEFEKINTPFGVAENKITHYFADLNDVLKTNNYHAYRFLGFWDLSYDPYKCLIRSDFIGYDGTTRNVLNVLISHENVDRSLIREILSVPKS